MSKVRNAKDQEQELSVREMILGVLKAKDQSGCNIIHSSDFRTAITDLGFPMGSSIIENILVHCKLDTRGNLDFSDLERELVRERRVHNSQKKPEAPPVSTSSGFVSKPWRGDEIHRAKVEAEKQLLTVTEHGPAVKEVYESLSHHHITAREALEQLQSLDIHPTKDFVKLLQSMTFNEVSYADFVRSLTRFSTHQDLEGAHVCAGTAKPKSGDVDIIGLQRKRSTTGMKTAFHESADVEVKTKTFRKMASAGSVNDQVIFKAKQIKETLFCDNEAVPLLSHNQADMVIGARGNKDLSIGFNIETRLQREQVLAALRKLDSGEITMDDFQDMLFSVGIDLPETLAVDIRRSAAAGRMDVRKYVKMMDANIFKANAIEDQISAEDAQKMKNKFRSAVLRQGLDALMDLSIIFRDVDTDNDGTLTFSEFKAGCAMLRLNHSLTDNDLRMLFNAFDKNGDGVLQHDEFISAIRGDVSPTRALWIRRAFQKIDRQGKGQVSIDTVGELFRAEGHPSIKVGQKTAREATTDLLRWFTTDQVSYSH